MSEQVQIPEDLADCYRLQKQALRCFRNDEDQVAIARRTMNHIERIAALQQECDALRAERIVAFVEGAKWWEYHSTAFTMWKSDQDEAHRIALERHPLAPKPAQEAQS